MIVLLHKELWKTAKTSRTYHGPSPKPVFTGLAVLFPKPWEWSNFMGRDLAQQNPIRGRPKLIWVGMAPPLKIDYSQDAAGEETREIRISTQVCLIGLV